MKKYFTIPLLFFLIVNSIIKTAEKNDIKNELNFLFEIKENAQSLLGKIKEWRYSTNFNDKNLYKMPFP